MRRRVAGGGGEVFLSSYADRLVKKHGRNADLVAIKRADALLSDGDEARGAWWLKLFRHIALANIAHRDT